MNKKELNIISQAILNEIEGYEFYKMAANQEGTGESKEAFLELANEELLHAEFLEELFHKIKSSDEDAIKLAYETSPPSPGIYDWKKLDSAYTSLAMSVFKIAMQMEKEAIDFYKKAMEETELEEARKLYSMLIEWEEVHLEQFSNQYESYRDEWWGSQSFSPF